MDEDKMIKPETTAIKTPAVLTTKIDSPANDNKLTDCNTSTTDIDSQTSQTLPKLHEIQSNLQKFIKENKASKANEWLQSLPQQDQTIIKSGVDAILQSALMIAARRSFDTVIRQKLATAENERERMERGKRNVLPSPPPQNARNNHGRFDRMGPVRHRNPPPPVYHHPLPMAPPPHSYRSYKEEEEQMRWRERERMEREEEMWRRDRRRTRSSRSSRRSGEDRNRRRSSKDPSSSRSRSRERHRSKEVRKHKHRSSRDRDQSRSRDERDHHHRYRSRERNSKSLKRDRDRDRSRSRDRERHRSRSSRSRRRSRSK